MAQVRAELEKVKKDLLARERYLIEVKMKYKYDRYRGDIEAKEQAKLDAAPAPPPVPRTPS